MKSHLRIKESQKKNSYLYTLEYESKNCYIFKQSDPTGESNREVFEVFIRHICRERVFKDRVLPRREVLPANKDFGKTAWTYPTYKRAYEKLEFLEIEIIEGLRRSIKKKK